MHESRRALRVFLPLVVTGGLVAGCGGSDDSSSSRSEATSTSSSATVSDQELGSAFDRLIHQRGATSSDDGACFAQAARSSDLSDEALARIVEVGGDDLGAAAEDLGDEVAGKDAQTLLSVGLREDLDACVNKDASPATSPSAESASSSSAAAAKEKAAAERKAKKRSSSSKTKSAAQKKKDKAAAQKKKAQRLKTERAKKARLKPKHEIKANEKITTAAQLEPGLITTFSSFAQDEKQKKSYQSSSDCLAQAVLDAGFSQETLRFLAGGPPIGEGSVVDHLPEDDDKKTWQSPEFTSALVDCTTGSADEEGDGIGD